MGKALLVLPQMPDDCMECRLCFNGKENMYCLAFTPERVILYRNNINYKPMYCPLRPMPEEVTDSVGCDEYYDGCKDGWNNCLREIGGLDD